MLWSSNFRESAETTIPSEYLKLEESLGLTLYVPIIAILDIWKTTFFYEGESVVYDEFKYVWPVKG